MLSEAKTKEIVDLLNEIYPNRPFNTRSFDGSTFVDFRGEPIQNSDLVYYLSTRKKELRKQISQVEEFMNSLRWDEAALEWKDK